MAVTAGIYVGFGVVAASLAPIVGPVSDDLGLSRSQMGAVLGAWQFVYLGAAVPAGLYLDRYGLRVGLTSGIALIVVSGLLRSTAEGWGSLLASVAVFGLGGPLISVGAPTLVSSWFPSHERGLATGIAVSGPVVGSMLTLLTANSILMPLFDQDWRRVTTTYAVVALATAIVFLAVTARPPATVAEPWARAVGDRQNPLALLQVPLVRLVLVLAVLTFFVNHAMANWLPEILESQGLSPAEAGFWAAIVSVPGLIAGIGLPRLARPSRRRPLLIGCYTLLGLGLAPLGFAWGPGAAIGLLIYGAMRSAVLPVAMLFLMDHRRVGPANMAGAGALYFTAGEIGGVTGPVAVGLVADGRSFDPAIGLLAAVAAVMAVIAVALPRTDAR